MFNHFIYNLYLVVGLRPINNGEAFLDAEPFVERFEVFAIELLPIISYYNMRNSESTNYVFVDEILQLVRRDGG